MTHRLHEEEVIPAGISSGDGAAAAIQAASRPGNKGKLVAAGI